MTVAFTSDWFNPPRIVAFPPLRFASHYSYSRPHFQMPFPSASFTQSKWLGFFAELTAKARHHSPAVVVEGCEVIRRLLLTRVSVAAFLEEGHLIGHLCDQLSSYVAAETLTPGSQAAVHCLLDVLSLMIDHTIALHCDGDEYFVLLSLGRCSTILRSLVIHVLGARATGPHAESAFGPASHLVTKLLKNLPLCQRVASGGWLPSGTSCARHVRALEEAVNSLCDAALDLDTSLQFAFSRRAGDVISQAAIVSVASRIRQAAAATPGDETRIPRTALENVELPHVALLAREVESMLVDARSSQACLKAISRLWCLMIVRPEREVAATFQPAVALSRYLRVRPNTLDDSAVYRGCLSVFAALLRHAPPATDINTSTVPAIASASTPDGHGATKEGPSTISTAAFVCDAIVPLVICSPAAPHPLLSPHPTSPLPTDFNSANRNSTSQRRVGQTSQLHVDVSNASTIVDRSGVASSVMPLSGLQSTAGGGGVPASSPPPHRSPWSPSPAITVGVGSPTTAPYAAPPTLPTSLRQAVTPVATAPQLDLTDLIFLHAVLVLPGLSSPRNAATWIKRHQLLTHLLGFVNTAASTCRTILVDAPNTSDGTLPDDIYLSCALANCRTDLAASAAVAMRVLSVLFDRVGHSLMAGGAATSLAASSIGPRRGGGSSSTASRGGSSSSQPAHSSSTPDGLLLISVLIPSAVDVRSDLTAAVQLLFPAAVTVILNNPTVTATLMPTSTEMPWAVASSVHAAPECDQSLRASGLGECAAVMLDSLLTLAAYQHMAIAQPTDIVGAAAAVARSTQRSIIPYLRGTAHRLLLRTCTQDASSIRQANTDMPSFTAAALQSVSASLTHSSDKPSERWDAWELSASALWIAAVLRCEQRLCPDGTRQLGSLYRSALPHQILQCVATSLSRRGDAAAAMSPLPDIVDYGTAAVLCLLNAIATPPPPPPTAAVASPPQRRVVVVEGDADANRGPPVAFDMATSRREVQLLALIPHGMQSVDLWTRVLEACAPHLGAICDAALDEHTVVLTVPEDASYRCQAALEDISVALWFAAEVSSSVHTILTSPANGGASSDLARAIATQEDSSHPSPLMSIDAFSCVFSQDAVMQLAERVFRMPRPEDIHGIVGARFGVHPSRSDVLVRAYSDAMGGAAEMLCAYFDTASGVNACSVFGPLTPGLLGSCADAMTYDRLVSVTARSAIAGFLLQVASTARLRQPALVESMAPCAGKLLRALAYLPGSSTAVALKCHLVAQYDHANSAARDDGLLRSEARTLDGIMAVYRVAGDITTEEHERLAMSVSVVASYFSFPNARPLMRDDAAPSVITSTDPQLPPPAVGGVDVDTDTNMSIATSLSTMLKQANKTRTLALSCARHMSLSHEGRNNLLLETARGIEGRGAAPLESRCTFSRLVDLTFFARLSQGDVALGTDAMTTALALGGNRFGKIVARTKVLDSIATTIAHFDRQRVAPPLYLWRLLGALTTLTEFQAVVLRRPELLTLVLEQSTQVTQAGTMAMLCLRNLCFLVPLRNQLCLDARVLRLLKEALWRLPRTVQTKTGLSLSPQQLQATSRKSPPFDASETVRAGSRSPKSSIEEEDYFNSAARASTNPQEDLRQQELAGTAIWALVHGSQKLKSSLRGALTAVPAVTVPRLVAMVEAADYTSPSGQLEGYHARMATVIDHLVAQGL